MTDEDDEFARVARETAMRQERCQHRWEEGTFGKQYWEPGTHQYTCHRCGKMSMVQVGIDQGAQK